MALTLARNAILFKIERDDIAFDFQLKFNTSHSSQLELYKNKETIDTLKDHEGIVNCAALNSLQKKCILELLRDDLNFINPLVQRENGAPGAAFNLRRHQDYCAGILGNVQHKLDENQLSDSLIFNCIAILYAQDQHKLSFKSTLLQEGLAYSELNAAMIQAATPSIQSSPPTRPHESSMASNNDPSVSQSHLTRPHNFSNIPHLPKPTDHKVKG